MSSGVDPTTTQSRSPGETRDYVKHVMSNATYYAAMFTGQPQSLKQRLGEIAPQGHVRTKLP